MFLRGLQPRKKSGVSAEVCKLGSVLMLPGGLQTRKSWFSTEVCNLGQIIVFH